MSLNICIPVLKRYDLLELLLESVDRSTLQPDGIYVINNGVGKVSQHPRVRVHTPSTPLGVAESWNWFIDNVPEDRLISNDDIEFAPESLACMQACDAPFVSCSYGFSCFILRDDCVRRVGVFDESISPGYAYFEDMDYLRRMKLVGVIDAVVECNVIHHQSSTLQRFTNDEMNAHNEKFGLARKNYEAKWGSPDWQQLVAIGGAGGA